MSLGLPVTSDTDETSQVLCIQIKEEYTSDEELGVIQDDRVERPRADLCREAGADFTESQASDEIQTVVVKSEEEEEEHRDDDSPRGSKKLAEKEPCSLVIKSFMVIIPKIGPSMSLIQGSLFL